MSEWVHIAGWVLLHFLWQGSVLAIVAAAALRSLRLSSPNIRYAVACVALGAMLAAPLLTAFVLASESSPAALATGSSLMGARPPLAVLGEAYFPVVVSIWLAGVAILLLRTCRGWCQVRRLHKAALAWAPSSWQPSATRLAQRLGLRTTVRVVEFTCVDVPTVLGWLRPVIILPVAAVVQLPVAQLEAVLAHELAHIRRHDYLVNLLQSLSEAVLFYHPAIWWISARVREEREHCCDDLAIDLCGDRDSYATALAELESRRTSAPSLRLAATDGPLLTRVRRILQLSGPEPGRTPNWTLTFVLAAMFALVAGGPQRSPALLAQATVSVAEALTPVFGAGWGEAVATSSIDGQLPARARHGLPDSDRTADGGSLTVPAQDVPSSPRVADRTSQGAEGPLGDVHRSERPLIGEPDTALADEALFVVRRSAAPANERARHLVDAMNVRAVNVHSRAVLDTLPAGRSLAGVAALTLGVVTRSTVGHGLAAGGSRGEGHDTALIAHGSRADDMQTMLDGMSLHSTQTLGGPSRQAGLNQAAIEETVVETGGGTAASETGGISINAVPREGGNTLRLYFSGFYTNRHLQGDNISGALRARGLGTVLNVKHAYDAAGGMGGRILRDRLWFYGAQRWWEGAEFIPGNYFNATPLTLSYTPDFARPAERPRIYRDTSLRLTWQATQKHKISVNQSYQRNCNCARGVELNQSPEASVDLHFSPNAQTIVSWTAPATSQFLMEAAAAHLLNNADVTPTDEAWRTQRSVLDQATGYRYGSQFLGGTTLDYWQGNDYSHFSTRASVSYVATSHALKVGANTLSGRYVAGGAPFHDVGYVFSNGLPVQLQEFASPHRVEARVAKMGVYGQDQWTIRQLTLNLGVRFDRFNAFVPEQVRPGGGFVPALHVGEVRNVPNWNDVSPRVGAAYDLFGDTKTAVKASFGRFLLTESIATAQANNPAAQVVTSVSRNWNDLTTFPAGDPRNGNFVPDCNIKDPLANGECGQISNLAFGQVHPNSVFDPALLTGMGVRPANWQTTLGIQHELRPGVGLNVGYFRTSYVNFRAATNTLVSPSDFDAYCITLPRDARLPSGGGNRLCGNVDSTLSTAGLSQFLIVAADKFGKQSEVFNGVDVSFNARSAGGALVSGGISTGRTVTDNCYQNDLPNVTAQGYLPGTPRTQAFCHVALPWSATTQVKASGMYPLPLNFQISAVYQNLAGAPVSATYVAANSEVSPSLGRHLSSCRGQVPCNGTVTLNAIPPGTLFEGRLQQLDLRVSKNIRIKKYRLRGNVDVYNLLNGRAVTGSNGRYGSSWLLPTAVQGARLFEFGGQIDF